MGYRSTLTTNDVGIPVPEWLIEKRKDHLHFGHDGKSFPISTRSEYKTYGVLEGLEEDLLRVVKESNKSWAEILLVIMGEDGVLYKSRINRDGIKPAQSNYVLTKLST